MSILIDYLFVFLIAGIPLVAIYIYFMKKLEHIEEENGFTDIDTT